MRVTRLLGIVGKVMIAAGCLILLFVAFQLWGTGLKTAQAQDDLGERFRAQQEQVADGTAPTLPVTDGSTPTTTGPATTPGTTSGPATADPAAFPPPKPGEPIGQIVIPKIGADFYMVEGVDLRWLQDGPGHFPGTPFPGQAGNAALAGHRTTFKAPFNRIDELVPGDTITVTTLQGTFTYRVLPQPGAQPGEELGYKIILPDQLEILDQPPGRNLLTLMACHPKYDLSQRIVVVAELVENPAPTTPKSAESAAAGNSFDPSGVLGGAGATDLVGGSPEARGPAVFWAAVAGLIWLAAWFVTRRWTWREWPKWLVYGLALPIFLVPLFFCFQHINELLPAGY